jgi:hypothetical protein
LELYSTDLAASDASSIPHTTQDGTVILHALVARHDVAVVGVHPWKTIVGQGYSMRINVTLANQGDFTETFNVTTYANTTTIQTKTITLTSKNSITITFTWNTTSFAKGNYTISAYAWPVQGETDTADNTFIDGFVVVAMVGDVNADGYINIKDIVLVSAIFGAKKGDPEYQPNPDVNGDGYINIKDIVLVSANFGATDP